MNKESFTICRKTARSSGSNFVRCFRFLPPEKRRALEVLYAFTRTTDDLADDERLPLAVRAQKLLDWRALTEKSLAGTVLPTVSETLPVEILPALAETAARFKIDRADLFAVINGCRTDAAGSPRFESENDAYAYCDRVASAVGFALLRILGTKKPPEDPALVEAARGCGRAFQWTNFLRDVREDYARQRVYFPMSDFAAARLDPADWLALLAEPEKKRPILRFRFADPHDPLAIFLRLQFERTEKLYRQSEPLADWIADDSTRFFRLMTAVYRAIFEKIRKKPEAIFMRRVRLSFLEKAGLVFRRA